MIRCKAAFLHGEKDIRIEEANLGDLKEDQVLVKVNTTTLCPTDLRKYLGYAEIPGPIILGHEISGIVEEAGGSVSSAAPGDRVVIYSILPCGICRYCRRHMPELCDNLIGIGGSAGSIRRYYENYLSHGIGGGLAEYIKIPEKLVLKLPSTIPLDYGSVVEPLANVIRGQSMCDPSPGKTELIFGAGPIGLMHLIAARSMGVGEVIVAEPLEERRRIAKEFGAAAVLNPKEDGFKEWVRELTHGVGPDIVVVATGWGAQAACSEIAVELAAKGGIINIFAATYPKMPIKIDPNDIHYKEIKILGSFDHRPWNYYEAVDLMVKNYDKIRKLIYPRFKLTDVKDAFESYGKKGSMKVAVDLG
ncbi:MAG: zinc-dependent alcohol dehydrogenase [Candidatus Bathyarchaeia archaeon]